MKVLIPTDDRAFSINFARAYQSLGHEVALGSINFEMETSSCDLLHVLWPEEFTSWDLPSEQMLTDVEDKLHRRKSTSSMVFTVNNIYPHGGHREPMWHRLYSLFFRHADLIHHFSQASLELVNQEYPEFADRNHLVIKGFNYDLVRKLRQLDRQQARKKYGLSDDEFVFLVFGSIRFQSELDLLCGAWNLSSIKEKKMLIVASKLPEKGKYLGAYREARFRKWRKSNNVTLINEFVPDSQLPELFDAADAVIVPREESLSSGVPLLAMSLGKYVLAPDMHAIGEYLEGLDNGLYQAGSPASLALEIDATAHKDLAGLGLQNEEVAGGWRWDSAITQILDRMKS